MSKQGVQSSVASIHSIYIQKWIYLIMMVLVLVGAFNWGLVGFFGFNLVQWIGSFLPRRGGNILVNIVYVLVGISAVFLMMDRNVYLPFLGEAVFPCDSLETRVPKGADMVVHVNVPAGSKVVYWASDEDQDQDKNLNTPVDNPWEAYGSYSNYGVCMANKKGEAELKVRKPVAYKVPTGRLLGEHVHYRYCRGSGMMSEVHTVMV